jgi:hypothetical protein
VPKGPPKLCSMMDDQLRVKRWKRVSRGAGEVQRCANANCATNLC